MMVPLAARKVLGVTAVTALLVACAGASSPSPSAPVDRWVDAGSPDAAASECVDGHDRLAVQPSPGVTFAPSDAEVAKTWKAAPTLGLAIAQPVIDGRTVKVVAVLSNDGTDTVEAFTLSGGMIGFSTNPMNASLKGVTVR
jgi:hypothetical protein